MDVDLWEWERGDLIREIERLRRKPFKADPVPWRDRALSAEAEIERLRRHDEAATQDAVLFRGRMVDAEAEIERLREALREIANLQPSWRYARAVNKDKRVRDIARAALEKP